MDKKDLIESALQLKNIKDSSALDYADKSELLVIRINDLLSKRKDILELIGENNLAMMYDNHSNHARFMSSIFTHYVPEVFVETILWVFRAYRSHGFTTNYWAAQLNAWMQIIQVELTSDAFSEIIPYYKWLQVNIPIFVKLSDEKLETAISGH